MVEMRQALIDKLIAELGYSPAGAASLAAKCLALPEDLRALASLWLADGSQSDAKAGQYTLLGLMAERGFNYPNALNVIAWLRREPAAAEAALKRPVDRIIRGPRHD